MAWSQGRVTWFPGCRSSIFPTFWRLNAVSSLRVIENSIIRFMIAHPSLAEQSPKQHKYGPDPTGPHWTSRSQQVRRHRKWSVLDIQCHVSATLSALCLYHPSRNPSKIFWRIPAVLGLSYYRRRFVAYVVNGLICNEWLMRRNTIR